MDELHSHKLSEPLNRYRQERESLLSRIIDSLDPDPRFTAAWLYGSSGRGEADALSDLDLWVVVRDDSIHDILAKRHKFTAQFGRLTLWVAAPGNAPEGGGFLTTAYDSPTAPHLVDWVWQPESKARIFPDTLLLFDHQGIMAGEVPFTGEKPVADWMQTPGHDLRFFWMMLLVSAKYLTRAPKPKSEKVFADMIAAYHRLFAKQKGNAAIDLPRSFGEGETPIEKLYSLQEMAVQVERLMQQYIANDIEVPVEIVPGALRYLELVKSALA